MLKTISFRPQVMSGSAQLEWSSRRPYAAPSERPISEPPEQQIRRLNGKRPSTEDHKEVNA